MNGSKGILGVRKQGNISPNLEKKIKQICCCREPCKSRSLPLLLLLFFTFPPFLLGQIIYLQTHSILISVGRGPDGNQNKTNLRVEGELSNFGGPLKIPCCPKAAEILRRKKIIKRIPKHKSEGDKWPQNFI